METLFTFTKQAILMRSLTVLSLPLQLVFPAEGDQGKQGGLIVPQMTQKTVQLQM